MLIELGSRTVDDDYLGETRDLVSLSARLGQFSR
jgi:hypothetical protein